jgi:hypothetical protein
MSDPEAIPAFPLEKRFKKRGDKSRFARELGVPIQNVTNWLRRGIPAKELHRVANWCGLTVEQYRREAGLDPSPHPLPMTSRVEGPMYENLLEYWVKLPKQLQEAILGVLKLASMIDVGGRRLGSNGGDHPRRRRTDAHYPTQ